MKLASSKLIADKVINIVKSAEERLAPDWVLLGGFPRSLQLDGFSCGAQCAFAVLKYFGKARSIRNVTRDLGTTGEGTDDNQMLSLFLRRGLRPVNLVSPTIKSLKQEINHGNPLIVSMDAETHYAVVYGYGNRCIFVADPSLKRGLLCRCSTPAFRARWDRLAMAIRQA